MSACASLGGRRVVVILIGRFFSETASTLGRNTSLRGLVSVPIERRVKHFGCIARSGLSRRFGRISRALDTRVTTTFMGRRNWVPGRCEAVRRITKPLVLIHKMRNMACSRLKRVRLTDNRAEEYGILRMGKDSILMRLFRDSANVGLSGDGMQFLKQDVRLNMSRSVLKHIFSKLNGPVSRNPRVLPSTEVSVGNLPVGPTTEYCPRRFVRAKMSTVSKLGALIHKRGLPVFSTSNLPRTRLTTRVTHRTGMLKAGRGFTIMFTTVNVAFRRSGFFVRDFHRAKTLSEAMLFMGLTGSPTVRHVTAPHVTLATTRCLTFRGSVRILIVLASVAGCTSTLHRMSTTEGRIPNHHKCPKCLCASLTALCRETKHRGNGGKDVAVVPVLAVPRSSGARPVPSLAKCVARKRVVLDHRLCEGKMAPPVSILPSLSHLGSGKVKTNGAETSRSGAVGRLFTTCTHNGSTGRLVIVLKRTTLARVSLGCTHFTSTFRGRCMSRKCRASQDVRRALGVN